MALPNTQLWRFLFLVPAVAAGCLAPRRSADPALVERLDGILHRLDHTGARFTARVLELPSGRELYAAGIDEPFIPASNMKLPVSAAALDLFGPQRPFKTYLALNGADLWLIGTGDPGAGDERIAARTGGQTTTVLEQWAAALAARGIQRIPGHLYYDDEALEALRVHPSWHTDDLVHWYAAPVSGLNFNGNCIDVAIEPAGAGLPVRYRVTPPAAGIEIVNRCVSGDAADPEITRAPEANVYTLSGGCRAPNPLKSKPVVDPGAFFADALRTHLQTRGIIIEGEIRRAPAPLGGVMPPPAERIVAVHETRLDDLLWRINKNSQNLFAECLCKLAGQEFEARRGRRVPGSWENGERAIRDFLKRNRINDRRLVVADGSGLSEKNRVTARLISDLLVAMDRHPYRDAFRASLSVAGQDGTLASRMNDLAGHVFAKTGQIRGVRALSGYIDQKSGGRLCFSIIYNQIPGSVKPYEELQDEVCRTLVSYPSLDAPAVPTKRHRDMTPRYARR